MQTISDRRRKERKSEKFDRRRLPRVQLSLDGVFFGDSRCLQVREGNMTLRGLFLKTGFPERPGSRGVLRLCLPGHSVMLKFDVEVVWANDDSSRPYSGMGVRILEQPDWQRKRIAACLLRKAGWAAFPSLVHCLAVS